jgi:carboxylesterase type B
MSLDLHPLIRACCNTIVSHDWGFLTILSTSSAKLPVMVWIYGGGFVDGASDRHDGSELVKQSLTIVC